MAKNLAYIPGAGAWNRYQEEIDGETISADPELIILEDEQGLPTSDELLQILFDIIDGKPAPEGEPAYLAESRARMAEDVEEILERGGNVEIPSDIA